MGSGRFWILSNQLFYVTNLIKSKSFLISDSHNKKILHNLTKSFLMYLFSIFTYVFFTRSIKNNDHLRLFCGESSRESNHLINSVSSEKVKHTQHHMCVQTCRSRRNKHKKFFAYNFDKDRGNNFL